MRLAISINCVRFIRYKVRPGLFGPFFVALPDGETPFLYNTLLYAAVRPAAGTECNY
jgi:hypothetical protein